jgi:transposase
MKDRIILNSREQRRVQILGWLAGGRISTEQAGQVLGLSRRQIQRLKRALLTDGPGALAHGNRGRPSARRLPDDELARITALARSDAYRGYNHTHFCEVLAEDHGLTLSRRTLSRVLRTEGMRSPRRRRPRQHRARRDRAAQRGLLVQVDASTHDWLEGRAPKLTLVGAIDDATGGLLAAHFRTSESSAGYLRLLQDAVSAHGVPGAWYSDRHSCFVRNDKEPWTLAEQLANRREPTQVARALEQLDVTLILAHSPQAKGRIERCWETLQDRLVKALRRAGACTIEEANAALDAYIIYHNQRFAVPPAEPDDAHRRIPRGLDLVGVCSLHYVRTVAADNTVRLEERLVQIPPGPRRRSYARCHVKLQERLDGELVVVHQGAIIARQPGTPGAVVVARKRHRGRELAADPPPDRPPAHPVSDVDLPADLFLPLVSEHPWRRAPLLVPRRQEKTDRAATCRGPSSLFPTEDYHLSTNPQVTDSLPS